MSKKNNSKKNTCKKHTENGVSLDVNTVKHAVIEQDDHVQTGNAGLAFIKTFPADVLYQLGVNG